MSIIYKGVSVGRTAIGRVDSGGIIYNASSGGSAIGQVDSDGIFYKGVSVGHTTIGQVDSSGIIYKGVSVGRTAIGRIDSEGIIYNASSGGSAIGQVDGEDKIPAGAAGAALLLLGLLDVQDNSVSSSSTSSSSYSTSEEKPGCIGMVFKFVDFCVRLFKTWSGRVGMLLGVIAGIAMSSSAKNFANALFIGIFACLLLLFFGGALGTLVGFIFRKSSKAGKFGGLIGAGILALADVIICLIKQMRTNETIMFACFGLAVGWILGTIIGAIVGAIRKQIARGKK